MFIGLSNRRNSSASVWLGISIISPNINMRVLTSTHHILSIWGQGGWNLAACIAKSWKMEARGDCDQLMHSTSNDSDFYRYLIDPLTGIRPDGNYSNYGTKIKHWSRECILFYSYIYVSNVILYSHLINFFLVLDSYPSLGEYGGHWLSILAYKNSSRSSLIIRELTSSLWWVAKLSIFFGKPCSIAHPILLGKGDDNDDETKTLFAK